MWAGGRVRALGPLCCGMHAAKRTRVLSVTEKHGRSGHLTFVTLGHQILQHGQLVIDEQQGLVYREAAPHCDHASDDARCPGAPAVRAVPGGGNDDDSQAVTKQRCWKVKPYSARSITSEVACR